MQKSCIYETQWKSVKSARNAEQSAIDNGWAMHTGVYADFGLAGIRAGNHNRQLAGYQSNDPANFTHHSIIETENVDKMSVLSVGVKIRVAMGL
jgi:hypothetical protein